MEYLPNAGYKIALIGATGAIGKEIVQLAQNDDRIQELTLVVRKRPEEWNTSLFKPKLVVLERSNFDDLSNLKSNFLGYDAFLCALGSHTDQGEEEFVKVDYTYCQNWAHLGLECGVKYFSIVSYSGAKIDSHFLYAKTKGRCEEALKKVGYPILTILKPGMLLNRQGDTRVIETIFSHLPFVTKVEAKDVGKCMLEHAIRTSKTQTMFKETVQVEFSNEDIKKFVIDLETTG